MTKLLLELRVDAESLGKTLGRRGGDSIRNILKGKYKISANLARNIAEKHGISISGPLSFFALSCNWKFFT